MKAINECISLKNGIKMPIINFGTGSLQNIQESIINAIKCGIRAIDTAQSYNNEVECGDAIQYILNNNIVKRDELFVITKLNAHKPVSYKIAKDSFYQSLKKLKVEYLDQYLIHAPNFTDGDKWKKINAEVWRAFEELYEDGLVKSIGVSNFMILHIEELLNTAKISPMINQIELHPRWQQKELCEFCKKNDIAISAAYSLMYGSEMNNPLLVEIANKYKKTVANILLRWAIQKKYLPIFRTANLEHLKQNLEILDFNITTKDMLKIESLNSHPIGCWGTTPESWYRYYYVLEQANSIDYRITYNLFGKFKLLQTKKSGNKLYKIYIFGIPIFDKVATKKGYNILLFGIKLFEIHIYKDTPQYLPRYES